MIEHDVFVYTAGIVDGEGYISVTPHSACNTYTPVVKVTSVDKVLTDFLLENLGGYVYKREFKGNQRPAYSWEIKNKKPVKKFLTPIRPYLLIKRRQADLVIEYCSYSMKQIHPKYLSFRKDVQDRLHEIYKLLRSYNRRGKPPATTERLGSS